MAVYSVDRVKGRAVVEREERGVDQHGGFFGEGPQSRPQPSPQFRTKHIRDGAPGKADHRNECRKLPSARHANPTEFGAGRAVATEDFKVPQQGGALELRDFVGHDVAKIGAESRVTGNGRHGQHGAQNEIEVSK